MVVSISSYLPRPAARPGRCLFGGLKFVAHFPNLLIHWFPNRDTFCATGRIFGVSSLISSVSGVIWSVSFDAVIWKN